MYKYKFPAEIIERDGAFEEFAKDASIVSVELKDGRVFSRILLVYPDFIGAIHGVKKLPFDPLDVKRIFQTPENLKDRSSQEWWKDGWSGWINE
jgi:hypothetical protein